MRPGSVLVDLAAPAGGNCELTQPGADADHRRRHAARRRSTSPAEVPVHASQLYARNLLNFLALIVEKGRAAASTCADEVLAGACVAHDGEPRQPRVAKLLETAQRSQLIAQRGCRRSRLRPASSGTANSADRLRSSATGELRCLEKAMNPAVLIASRLRLRAGRISRLPGHQPRAAAAAHAADVGHQRHLRHLADRLAGARRRQRDYPAARRTSCGFVAVTTATINVVGGFGITDRMLKMFGKRKPKPRRRKTEGGPEMSSAPPTSWKPPT